MSEHWTNYWQQGHLTSFGGGFKANYVGELKSFWNKFASKIEKHSTILDIGTGNGALIELLQVNHNFNCVGIDNAVIHKGYIESSRGVLLSGISAEELPFENSHFDYVISQFAIEYTDIENSLKEVYRVLKSKHNFVFVCHHPESSIIKSNEEILEMSIAIKNGLFVHMDALVMALASNEELIKENFSVIEAFIKDKSNKINGLLGTNLLAFIDFLKRNQGKKIKFVEAYESFKKEIELLILRLEELIHAANNLESIIEILNQNEFNFEIGYIREDKSGELLACFLTVHN